MPNNILWFLLVVGLSLVGVVGDYFIKLSGSGSRYVSWKWLLLGVVIYASTAFGWFFAFKHTKLSVLGVTYAVSTVLFLTLMSVFLFKERLTPYEAIGMALGVVSLIILARFA